MEIHKALYWDHCFLTYTLHHAAIISSFDLNGKRYAMILTFTFSYEYQNVLNL